MIDESCDHNLPSAVAPVKPCSSLTVQAMTIVGMPGGRSWARRATAPSIAVMPPLMSHEPRPNSRPSRTTGFHGSIVMPVTGTVS